jgi:signal transduction histidine kinase
MELSLMDHSPKPAAIRLTDSTEVTATLDEIDIRSALQNRPHRVPDYEAEHWAFGALAREMAENPRNMLQKLVEIAVELCNAGTAGISLIEGPLFRWEALAGIFGSYRRSTMPFDASPCGVCVNRDETQLMHLPDRHFPALRTEPRFVETLLIPFHDHGKPIGTVWIVAHDFAHKFDGEDERIVRTLAEFASAGWQLWKASEEAVQSNQNKDEFLAQLGHELRNPLSAILYAADSLRILETTNPFAVQSLDLIERQGRHLRAMVDDLIDLSRINRGKLELRKKAVELKTIVDHAIETTRSQIEHRQHRLTVSLPDDAVWIDGDPVRLVQLLSNLLDNAAKYTPEGGDVSVAAELAGDKVCIRISDTGIGIPANRLQSIFERFTQLSEEGSGASSSGIGLGLALVRTLAELHGGSVTVKRREEGKGTEFTVKLPSLPRASETPDMEASATITAPSRRILLVEDNEDVAESMEMLLALDGHQVKVAPNGVTALGSLRPFNPDVVLLDIGLPDMDGYKVARQMREQSNREDLIIIALSGFGQPDHLQRSQEAGCNAHLVKPILPDVLRDHLDGIGGTRYETMRR